MSPAANFSPSKRPIVFISYSHDSAAHRELVRRLAMHLREEDCDCRIHLDAGGRIASWPRWMRQQIEKTEVVLMVFTQTYRRRFDGDEEPGRGLGATWESSIIENSLHAAAAGAALLKSCRWRSGRVTPDMSPPASFSGTIYRLPSDWKRLVNRVQPNKVTKAATSLGVAARKPKQRAALTSLRRRFLCSSPEKRTGLDLRGQLSKTRAAVARARFGPSIELRGLSDLTPEQMLMELNDRCPDSLHLSGKQERGQVKMHNVRRLPTSVSAERLASLLGQYHALRLVILHTFWSLPEARLIVRRIDSAAGVKAEIAELVATGFYELFLNALANGSSLRNAHQLAHGLQLAKIEGDRGYRRAVEERLETKFDQDQHLPKLMTRRGVDGNAPPISRPFASIR